MSYCLVVVDGRCLKSAELAQLIVDRRGSSPETMRHLVALESLEARGCRYSNQDFDVLSAAYHYATEADRAPYRTADDDWNDT